MPASHHHALRYKCPCGKGFYTVNHYRDEQGPVDEHWEMNCTECKQRYQLSLFLKETKQGINESYVWAPINVFSELAIAEGQLKKAQDDALALARELYLEKWIMHCCKGESKKDIWRRLSDDGRREPDYALFDGLVNDLNMSEYLKDYFHFHNMEYILKKLGVRDLRLEDMRRRINGLQQKVERVQAMMRMEGFVKQSKYDM